MVSSTQDSQFFCGVYSRLYNPPSVTSGYSVQDRYFIAYPKNYTSRIYYVKQTHGVYNKRDGHTKMTPDGKGRAKT